MDIVWVITNFFSLMFILIFINRFIHYNLFWKDFRGPNFLLLCTFPVTSKLTSDCILQLGIIPTIFATINTQLLFLFTTRMKGQTAMR